MTEDIAIAGSGAIACGIAVTVARAGEARLWARSEASAERARSRIATLCERIEAADPERIAVSTDLEALASASFVVEAIAEDLELKRGLYERLDQVCHDDAVLASTTSSLSVAALAAASGREDRFAAIHVFNPVPRMDLVELCFPDSASERTRARTRALCETWGKTIVECPDIPGFVVNRLLFPFLFEAVRLTERTGLDAAEVDTAMTLGAGQPMGPFALLDFVGLDVAAAIGEEIGVEVPWRLRELVEAGELGRKSGGGFLRYGPRG